MEFFLPHLSQLATMILQSILENKILRWKVKLEIYFPKRKVVSKVSVEPCTVCSPTRT